MVNSTLSIIANINAHHNSMITPSTGIIIQMSMVNAIIPSIIITTCINHCRAVVTTITSTVVIITTSTMCD